MGDAPDSHIWIGHTKLSQGSGGEHRHVHPFTGAEQAAIPLAGRKEVNDAVAKAVAVADEWRYWAPARRRQALLKLADLMEENTQEISRRSALDIGIATSMGPLLTMFAVEWTRYYAGWTDKLNGDLLSTHGPTDELAYTAPEPYGVVGVITTWNGPVVSLGMKVAPALAAGNCVIVKPAEFTPFVPELYAELAKEAGLPDGVLSLLPGSVAAGEALVAHEQVEKISFTGGPVAASSILATCAKQMKPAVLELGGKSACLVFPDVDDLEMVCQSITRTVMGTMAGQGCALPTRVLVHREIYEHASARIADIAANLKSGDPLSEDTEVGPVLNVAAVERILGMFERARADGAATFAAGGHRLGGELADKNFIAPTVITDADPAHEISQMEIFGPALTVQRFDDDEDAVAKANSTRYGLAAYIYSSNVGRCHRLAEKLRSGGVYVNGATSIRPHTPFGGVGISGYGKEGGRAGIDEYLRYKTISLA